MIDDCALSEVEWHPDEWKYQKLVASLKSMEGKLWIDLRKWLPKGRPEDNQMRRSKGLMLELEHWKRVLPLITKFIDDASTQKRLNAPE